jgi:predicted CXXCH cytochrome family protein
MRGRGLILGMALAALAIASGALFAADGVPRPAVPKGQGEKCVADTAVMRREHMTFLLHQRDATVHEGLRTPRHSLAECLACHAVAGPDARPVGYDSPKHFCRSCHDYAAVMIDCFACHSAKPAERAAPRAEAMR